MDKMDQLFAQFPIFETRRLRFRPLTEEDADDLLLLYSDEEVFKYQGFDGFTSMESIMKFIEIVQYGYEHKQFVRWGVELKDNQKLVGMISLHHLEHWNKKTEVGYMLMRSYWNHGLMTEAVSALMDRTLNAFGFHRVEAMIHPDNLASIALIKKCGFEEEGYRREAAWNDGLGIYEDRILFARLGQE